MMTQASSRSFKLIDDARVVIYDPNGFMIQATALVPKMLVKLTPSWTNLMLNGLNPG